jgi:hypothetical protein
MPHSFWPLLGQDITNVGSFIAGLVTALLLLRLIDSLFYMLEKQSRSLW